MVINMDIKEGWVHEEPQVLLTRRGRPKLVFRLAVARDGTRAAKYGETGGTGRGVDMIHVVMYGERGEALQPLLRKGAQVVVFGWTQSRVYTAKDGSRRMVTETVAERITFLPEAWRDGGWHVVGMGNEMDGAVGEAGSPPQVDGDDSAE
ncbi:MAG: single-stranded DNA-binding protein [Chloroflexi bacterium]|nr:single-stranded DNA-binding protein [Chloroflexota bacterium]